MDQVALNEEQRLYLQFILDYFREYTRWPMHRQLDQFFLHNHPDTEDINLLDNQAILTIPGMYALEPNAPEFTLFLKIIQLCVDTYLRSENHELGSEDILRHHPTWDESDVYRAGWLLLGEPNIWQSFAGPDQSGQWRCTVARGIRRFRGITTIEDYLEKRNPPRSQPQAPPSFSPGDADVSTDMSVQPQRVVLHPDIHARCWILYTQGDYDNAILNATKAIEVAVRKKAQLADEVVGTDVVNLAFSLKNPLLQYSQVKAEQEGMMSLLRGIIQVYKNPQSHRFVGIQDASECLGILLMCSSLLSLIDRL